jgi:dihydroceramide fatty acyl 2-hydroxylase
MMHVKTTTLSQSVRANTARMFKSDLLEFFSRIHPVSPFVVWLPVVAFFIRRCILRADVRLHTGLALGVLGLFLWTLAEYLLHRYVFHWINDSAAGKRIHFLLHGVHHDFPQDRDRLVMPIGASAPIAVVVYGVFYLLVGSYTYAEPTYIGFVLGYLIYDGSHFAIHHYNFQAGWFRSLKRHHMLHHHLDRAGGFGVSSPLWDLVFRSMPSVKQRPSR